MHVRVTIQRLEQSTPNSKLADAELHFVGGELNGLKLVGFAVWPRRDGGGYTVTFPARSFKVHGQRRYFTLLRATADPTAENEVRRLILEAFRASAEQGPAGAVRR